MKRLVVAVALVVAACTLAQAQGNRPASPAGVAATQVSGKYVAGPNGSSYQGGKWIEISYGRPIKRGRDLFGSGATYGKELVGDAAAWRAGANQTTTLKSDVPLIVGGKTLAANTEYYLLIDLKPNAWTLIVTTQPSQKKYDPANKTELWGSFNYKPDNDVVRVPMTLNTMPMSVDQLTWAFTDVTADGGTMTIMWDKNVASVPFKVGS